MALPVEPVDDVETPTEPPGEGQPGGEETPETPEGAEASGEETPEGEETPGEGEEGAEDEEPGEQPPADAGKRGKSNRRSGWERSRLRIEQLQRANEQLTQQLIAQGGRPAPGQPPPAQTPAQKAEEYVRALARQEWEQLDQQRKTQADQSEFAKRAGEVRGKHDDFDEVVASVSHIPVPEYLNRAILTSEQGPEIMYQLASNPAELARLSALPPLDAAREVGRLEAKLAAKAPPARTAKRPTAPPSSVNGAAKSTRDILDQDVRAYKKAYRAGRRA